MGRDMLSVRQITVLLVTALLAPLTDLLPGLMAWTAGSGGWLAALGALPLLLLALWTAKTGRSLSGTAKCIVNIMYLLWIPLPLAMFLRLSGLRLATIYGKGAGFICATALLSVAVWMAVGKVSAFARAAEIFYLLLTVTLAGVLILAVFKVEWGNLSITVDELTELPIGSALTAGIILNVYPVAVLKEKRVRKVGDGRKTAVWTVVFSVAIALILVAVIGSLGPALTTKVPSPFLIMVQGLGIKGAFQRTEALVAALWIVSDLTMAGVLLHAWRALAGEVRPGKWCRWSVIPVAAIALAAAWIFIPEGNGTKYIYGMLLPAGGVLFGLMIPLALRIVVRFSKKDD